MGVWPTTQQTEESQMATRESDAVIIPLITGNAAGGKDGTQVGLVQGTHFLYTGIGEKNGNKTG